MIKRMMIAAAAEEMVVAAGFDVIFKTAMIDNSSVNASTSYTQRSVFNSTPTINNGDFSVDSNGITIPEDGIYICSFTCFFDSPLSRSNVGVKWEINGTAQDEISASNYSRVATDNLVSTGLDTMYNLSESDVLKLQFACLAVTGTMTLQGTESVVQVYRVG